MSVKPFIAVIAQVCRESRQQVCQECVKLPLIHVEIKIWVVEYSTFGLNFLRLFHPCAKLDSRPKSLLPVTIGGKEVDNTILGEISSLKLIFWGDDVVPFFNAAKGGASETFPALKNVTINSLKAHDKVIDFNVQRGFPFTGQFDPLVKGR